MCRVLTQTANHITPLEPGRKFARFIPSDYSCTPLSHIHAPSVRRFADDLGMLTYSRYLSERDLNNKPVQITCTLHDDVIKWKHFSRYWPFVRGIHRSPVNSPHKWPVTRGFDVFFDLRLNKRFSKQWWGWWFETLSRSLWRHSNVVR